MARITSVLRDLSDDNRYLLKSGDKMVQVAGNSYLLVPVLGLSGKTIVTSMGLVKDAKVLRVLSQPDGAVRYSGEFAEQTG